MKFKNFCLFFLCFLLLLWFLMLSHLHLGLCSSHSAQQGSQSSIQHSRIFLMYCFLVGLWCAWRCMFPGCGTCTSFSCLLVEICNPLLWCSYALLLFGQNSPAVAGIVNSRAARIVCGLCGSNRDSTSDLCLQGKSSKLIVLQPLHCLLFMLQTSTECLMSFNVLDSSRV